MVAGAVRGRHWAVISVIIPTWNRADLLGRAIRSVLAQDLTPGELIVIDDGSTDCTPNMVRAMADQVEVPIRLLRQENRGAAAARNRGIEAVRGELLAFLDSDDWWLPNKLALQATALATHPGHLISHTRELWYRGGCRVNQKRKHDPPDGDIFAASLGLCVIGMSTVMARRELFARYGLFDETLPCCEDYDFWLRVGSREPFLRIDEPLTGKDGGRPDQLSAVHRQGMDALHIRSLRTLLDGDLLSAEQQQQAKRELVRKCFIYGQGCSKHGRAREGAEYLALAARYQLFPEEPA